VIRHEITRRVRPDHIAQSGLFPLGHGEVTEHVQVFAVDPFDELVLVQKFDPVDHSRTGRRLNGRRRVRRPHDPKVHCPGQVTRLGDPYCDVVAPVNIFWKL
jgi:hypothetical protein